MDCPWEYRSRHETRSDNPEKKTKFGIGVAQRYSQGVMTEQDLIDLGPLIQGIAAPDAYVFSWVVRPSLDMGLRVLTGWKLEYKQTPFTWEKTNLDGSTFKGTGRYTFGNLEDVFLGRYPGTKCWHPNTGYRPQMLHRTVHPKWQGLPHSRKPEIIQDEIEKWLGPHLGDYEMVELFATRQRPGWTCYGGDVTGNDIRDDLLYHMLSL